MTEYDLAKTEDLLDVSYPLLTRIVDQRDSTIEFDTVFGSDELVRLKQWKSHIPSTAPKPIPLW